MHYILLFILLSISTKIQATNFSFDESREEYSIKFGGWSYHNNTFLEDYYKEKTGKNFNYNENHKGLGFEYSIPFQNTNHYIQTGVWYMKDSYNENTYHVGIGYKYRWDLETINSIDFNVNLVYMNRTDIYSRINMDSHKHRKEDGQVITIIDDITYDFKIIREELLLPVPHITFNITEHFNIDFSLLFIKTELLQVFQGEEQLVVEEKSEWDDIYFVRFGYTF